jgi:hypothetical protein
MRDLIEYRCIRHRHLRHQTRNVCCLNLKNIEINLRNSTRFDDCWRCKFIVDSIWDQCILNFRVFSFELILTVYLSHSLLVSCRRIRYCWLRTDSSFVSSRRSTRISMIWIQLSMFFYDWHIDRMIVSQFYFLLEFCLL